MSKQRTSEPSSSQKPDSEAIPIVEEELRLDKREVATGKVRVSTVVDVVEELAQASLEEETVEVTRVPIDRAVGEAPAIRTEDGVTIIPVLEEILGRGEEAGPQGRTAYPSTHPIGRGQGASQAAQAEGRCGAVASG